MLKNLRSFFFFILFWLLFFALCRFCFVLFYWQRYDSAGPVAESFLMGLKLDLAMTAYFSILPLLVWSILFLFTGATLPRYWLRIYSLLLIVIVSILTVADINIYREWGNKINYRAMYYLFVTPKEAMASSGSSPLFLSIAVIAILIVIGIFLSLKLIRTEKYPVKLHFLLKLPLIVLFFGCLFLAMRGGAGLSPLQQSSVYFSDELIVNHTALNTEWNLMDDIVNNLKADENPYLYFPEEDAEKSVAHLYAHPDADTLSILKTGRPNIVLIVMESCTANVIGALGGEKGVMPFMDTLITKGLLFTHIYASGDRTDKGLAAVLSAFPSQAIRSIINIPYKSEKLPALPDVLKNEGYATSFYYGGESDFFNFRSYLLSHGFEKITDERDFEKKDMNSKWGAHDGIVMNRMLTDMKDMHEPFFLTLMTLSNHEPFEVPEEPHFKGSDLPNKFRSTSYYTDECLRNFFTQAEKESWYGNTLFILVADHGHRLPLEIQGNDKPEKFTIPLLFCGGALREEMQGMKADMYGSQTDIIATILHQMKIPYDAFIFSKDLLNPDAEQFAFYDYENGFGWVNPQQAIAFDNVGRKISWIKNPADTSEIAAMIKNGQAYLQVVYQKYMEYGNGQQNATAK